VYKHIAVIRYIDVHGSVDRSVDIYQNWPGFFALNAMLARVTGVDPLRYANWTQVIFPLANLAALRFVFGELTSDRRRINIALLIFLFGAWVEYGYLAPQSFAFFLTLIIMGIVLRWLRPDPARRPEVSTAVAIGAVLAISVAIVISHQLTPFFLVLNLGLLVVFRRCRGWWLPAAVVVFTVLWIALAHDYLSVHFPSLFSGNPFANVKPGNHPVPGAGSSGEQFIALTARVLTLLVALTAAAGAWRDHRTGRRQNLVLALAAAPILLVAVQSYGGEGIYRIYLFMVPWLAFLGSGLFATSDVRLSTRRAISLLAGSLVGGFLFLTAYYGLEHEDYIPPQEVSATAWFDAHSPSGSVLMMLVENHPYPLDANYDEHLARYGHYSVDVLSDPAWVNRRLGEADVAKLHDFVTANGPDTYLCLSPSQIVYAENHGYAPAGSLIPFVEDIVASKQFRVVFQQGDSYLLLPTPAAG
jgi:hypothetical protein